MYDEHPVSNTSTEPNMAKQPSTSDIARTIQALRDERQRLAARMAEIDAFFSSIGGATPTVPAGQRGRPPKAAAAGVKVPLGKRGRKKGGRGKFAMTGDELVYQYIKNNGPVTAAQVNAHWQAERRGGKADNALTKLTATGRVKREKIKDGRGSNYTAK